MGASSGPGAFIATRIAERALHDMAVASTWSEDEPGRGAIARWFSGE